MTTLHIEHPVTDFPTWRAAFERFGPARADAGVRRFRIQRPLDDDHRVLVELDFDEAAAAAAFLGFLREVVWAVPENSPALAGTPETRILRRAD